MPHGQMDAVCSARFPVGCVIGLVNLMPGEMMHAVTRRFLTLLARCAGFGVTVRVYAAAGAGPRDDALKYSPIEMLWDEPVDGLIVTGTVPLAGQMEQEPSWPVITQLVDWAKENSKSAIWSCFAAHAAVLHIDRIPRQRMARKLSGVYESTRDEEHVALNGLPSSWRVPHSRYNTLCNDALASHGYVIMSRLQDGSADMFAKRHGQSEFLFLQGHLEYGPQTLLMEYRRDLGQFSKRHRDERPAFPEHYFEQETLAVLEAWESTMNSGNRLEALAEFDRIAKALRPFAWQGVSDAFFRSWLLHLTLKNVTYA